MQASLRRLRTNQVDLTQLHNVSDPRQDLAMLRDWKAQGLCRYIGITTTYHGDFAAAEAILRREKPDFLEIDYSIDDREAQKRLIPAAVEVGAARAHRPALRPRPHLQLGTASAAAGLGRANSAPRAGASSSSNICSAIRR